MASVFDKLNLKDQTAVVVLGAPSSFEAELKGLAGVSVVRNAAKVKSVDFALVFVTKPSDVESALKRVVAKVEGDTVLWFAYPKGTSKRYRSTINRDTGWESLKSAGFETVRLVAIDEDWSALRFRQTRYVGSKKKSAR